MHRVCHKSKQIGKMVPHCQPRVSVLAAILYKSMQVDTNFSFNAPTCLHGDRAVLCKTKECSILDSCFRREYQMQKYIRDNSQLMEIERWKVIVRIARNVEPRDMTICISLQSSDAAFNLEIKVVFNRIAFSIKDPADHPYKFNERPAFNIAMNLAMIFAMDA